MSDTLNKLFLFRNAGISKSEIKSLFAVRSLNNGDTVCHRLSGERFLGVVLSGRIAAFSQSGTPLNIFSAGDVFGAASVLSGGFVSEVTALCESKIAVMDAETLKNLFAEYPAAAVNFVTFLSDRIDFLNRKIDIFTSPDCESRVYSALLAAADGNEVYVNKRHLAGTLDVGRTSIYRALDSLEEKGLVKKAENGSYIILR